MNDRGAAARAGRGFGAALSIVVVAALFARLAFVAIMPRAILWPDGLEYESVARSLLAHQGFGLQTLRPPGYPTLIAAVYALFGPHLVPLRIVESLLGTAAVALVGVFGARAFGPVAGLIAAALMALHPVLAFLPCTQYSENTVVLLVTLAFGAVFAAMRGGGPWRWALAGAMFGLAALVRPTIVFLLPGLAVGLGLALRTLGRPRVGPALIAALAMAITIAPWVVRCHTVHGRWYFIASGGGRQFWFGNNPRATAETSSPTPWSAAERESLAAQPDDLARERWHYREGWRFVRAQPARAGALYLKELGNLFSLWPDTFSRKVAIGDAGRWAQSLASLALFAGALLAFARLRATPPAWPLAGAIVTYALGSAVFFTVMRYRMVIEPLLLWLAGSGYGRTRLGIAVAGLLSPQAGAKAPGDPLTVSR